MGLIDSSCYFSSFPLSDVVFCFVVVGVGSVWKKKHENYLRLQNLNDKHANLKTYGRPITSQKSLKVTTIYHQFLKTLKSKQNWRVFNG